MKYSVAAQSVTGRVRRQNEDNLFLDGEILDLVHKDSALLSRELTDDIPRLVGIFDGMGGHDSGEVASYIAAATTRECAGIQSPCDSKEAFLNAICMEANDAVCEKAEGSQMGTTCAMVYFHKGTYTVCNVGDSPVFLFRNGAMRQISVDHNQRATYEKITGQKAPAGQKFKLTQCIGIPADEMLIEPHIASGNVRNGDIFLICSDGLTDMVVPEDIAEILRVCKVPEQAVEELITRAMEAGGRDNITIVYAAAEGTSNRVRTLDGFLKQFFDKK